MTDEPHPIWASMERAVRVAPGQTDVLLDADAAPRPLSPWAFWLLIGLVRQRARQDWAIGIVRDHLGISVAQLAASRKTYALMPADGVVPGLMDWAYEVGTWIFQLTHRLTGEFIRVACYEETGQVICGRYCVAYLRNKRSPEPPERRLRELHPSVWTIGLAQRELQRAGLLLPFPNARDAFTFPPQVVDRFDLVSAFCETWCDDARRLGAALAVGDWMAAADMGPDPGTDVRARIQAEALACRGRRVRMLLKRLKSKKWGGTALTALAEADPQCADAAMKGVLLGRRLDLAETALEMIDGFDDPSWCPFVDCLFERLNPNRSHAQARCWRLSAEILLRHGVKTRFVLKQLSQARRFQVAKVALLALRYDPSRAAPLFLRALRSTDSLDRTPAAAMLAILDEHWSRRLLLEVMHESDDVEAAVECCCALSFSVDPSVRAAAEQWDQEFDSRPESKNWFVSAVRADADEEMQAAMDEYHDTVLPLRGRVP